MNAHLSDKEAAVSASLAAISASYHGFKYNYQMCICWNHTWIKPLKPADLSWIQFLSGTIKNCLEVLYRASNKQQWKEKNSLLNSKLWQDQANMGLLLMDSWAEKEENGEDRREESVDIRKCRCSSTRYETGICWKSQVTTKKSSTSTLTNEVSAATIWPHLKRMDIYNYLMGDCVGGSKHEAGTQFSKREEWQAENTGLVSFHIESPHVT